MRELIRNLLDFLGLQLDDTANQQNTAHLNRPDSKPIFYLPADEEGEIFHLTQGLRAAV